MAGMDNELTNQLISGDYADFENLVDKAIRQEDQRNKLDRKRNSIPATVLFPRDLLGNMGLKENNLEHLCGLQPREIVLP